MLHYKFFIANLSLRMPFHSISFDIVKHLHWRGRSHTVWNQARLSPSFPLMPRSSPVAKQDLFLIQEMLPRICFTGAISAIDQGFSYKQSLPPSTLFAPYLFDQPDPSNFFHFEGGFACSPLCNIVPVPVWCTIKSFAFFADN